MTSPFADNTKIVTPYGSRLLMHMEGCWRFVRGNYNTFDYYYSFQVL